MDKACCTSSHTAAAEKKRKQTSTEVVCKQSTVEKQQHKLVLLHFLVLHKNEVKTEKSGGGSDGEMKQDYSDWLVKMLT